MIQNIFGDSAIHFAMQVTIAQAMRNSIAQAMQVKTADTMLILDVASADLQQIF